MPRDCFHVINTINIPETNSPDVSKILAGGCDSCSPCAHAVLSSIIIRLPRTASAPSPFLIAIADIPIIPTRDEGRAGPVPRRKAWIRKDRVIYKRRKQRDRIVGRVVGAKVEVKAKPGRQLRRIELPEGPETETSRARSLRVSTKRRKKPRDDESHLRAPLSRSGNSAYECSSRMRRTRPI